MKKIRSCDSRVYFDRGERAGIARRHLSRRSRQEFSRLFISLFLDAYGFLVSLPFRTLLGSFFRPASSVSLHSPAVTCPLFKILSTIFSHTLFLSRFFFFFFFFFFLSRLLALSIFRPLTIGYIGISFY